MLRAEANRKSTKRMPIKTMFEQFFPGVEYTEKIKHKVPKVRERLTYAINARQREECLRSDDREEHSWKFFMDNSRDPRGDRRNAGKVVRSVEEDAGRRHQTAVEPPATGTSTYHDADYSPLMHFIRSFPLISQGTQAPRPSTPR